MAMSREPSGLRSQSAGKPRRHAGPPPGAGGHQSSKLQGLYTRSGAHSSRAPLQGAPSHQTVHSNFQAPSTKQTHDSDSPMLCPTSRAGRWPWARAAGLVPHTWRRTQALDCPLSTVHPNAESLQPKLDRGGKLRPQALRVRSVLCTGLSLILRL